MWPPSVVEADPVTNDAACVLQGLTKSVKSADLLSDVQAISGRALTHQVINSSTTSVSAEYVMNALCVGFACFVARSAPNIYLQARVVWKRNLQAGLYAAT
jgi:hypothetical protein